MMLSSTLPPALPQAMARRLWRAFSVGRMVAALVLVALLLAMLQMAASQRPGSSSYASLSLLTGYGYLLVAVINWVLLRHQPPSQPWGLPWLLVLATEVLSICLIQFLQLLQPGSNTLHFAPLLALPVLNVACLGSLRMAWATTAAITLLLLGGHSLAVWYGLPGGIHSIVQAATICLGYFVMAWLTQQLAQRLAWQEHLARKNHRLARTQAEINGLIISQISEGVLVVDRRTLHIYQANPAALALLGCQQAAPDSLGSHPAWQPLCDVLQQCPMSGQMHSSRVHILEPGHAPVGLYVRVWQSHFSLDDGLSGGPQPLPGDSSFDPEARDVCLMFLEDLRELEARLRTEKMAAMGRISAAVAHEIRNPLAAITQANALLQEELTQPGQQRLAQMVAQNALRLAHTVEDVLDIARVQQQIQHQPSASLALDATLSTIWREWLAQQPGTSTPAPAPATAPQRPGRLRLQCPGMVAFDSEHLRRVVVNLLDNALRHSQGDDPLRLQLLSGRNQQGVAWLQVWSQGPELEHAVQNHLFEPFFSSQSRSSGLGLFICRELCQRHGASISYQRHAQAISQGALAEGNAFHVHFMPGTAAAPAGGETASLFGPDSLRSGL